MSGAEARAARQAPITTSGWRSSLRTWAMTALSIPAAEMRAMGGPSAALKVRLSIRPGDVGPDGSVTQSRTSDAQYLNVEAVVLDAFRDRFQIGRRPCLSFCASADPRRRLCSREDVNAPLGQYLGVGWARP